MHGPGVACVVPGVVGPRPIVLRDYVAAMLPAPQKEMGSGNSFCGIVPQLVEQCLDPPATATAKSVRGGVR